ncbi:MAG: tetratricopeptide repeat protein [Bacteroidales bacterium]|nr:tetratricopeptide repeat protein [Bacteroidales bacterium]
MGILRTLTLMVLLAFIAVLPLKAQRISSKTQAENKFKLAVELFEDKKYGAARQAFNNILDHQEILPNHQRSETAYYLAMCALKLDNGNAEKLLEEYLSENPEHTKTQKMYFHLANHQFNDKQYSDALKYYKKTNLRNLSNQEITQYYFKKGYCHLKKNDLDDAEMAFNEIKDIPSEYQEDALYFYSHLQYEKGNHSIALEGFEKLRDSKKYSKNVTSYIIQTYFTQERYTELIEIAAPYIKTAAREQKAELSRLLGESYYRTDDMANALPYLESYQTLSRGKVSRENHYQLGYIYYHNKLFEQAMKQFEYAADGNDALAQNAHYHLGMCYIQTDQKRFAGNSFMKAYQYDFESEIKEDALFNFAKLAYENIDGIYTNAVDAIQEYIKQYPNSSRADLARSYLVDIFMSTNDYKKALASFDQITLKNRKLKEAYQKIAFNRGLELYNDNNFYEAISTLTKSQSYDYDRNLNALSYYWIAESYFQLKKFRESATFFGKFIEMPGAYSIKEFPRAYYGKAYAHFQQKQYSDAIVSFRKYIAGTKDREKNLTSDALCRLGDCYFVNKQYDLAISYYDKAINSRGVDADYAMYQKALAIGGQGNFSGKIAELNRLLSAYSRSTYADDAEFGCGLSYLLINNNEKAVGHFKNVINKYPNSSYVPQSMLKTGLVYYDLMQNELALNTLKQVVVKYPGTKESKQALNSIRNVSVEMNQVDDYFAYVNSVSNGNVTATEQDSLMYIAAETQYMNGNHVQGRKSLESYLDRFPHGAFAMSAHFYKAEIDFIDKKFPEALESYQVVLQSANNKFTETSLFKTSAIKLREKKYNDALELFVRLEQVAENKDNLKSSLHGQMYCNHELKNFDDAILSAQRYLASAKLDEKQEVEARSIIAKSALALHDYTLSRTEFTKVMEKSSANLGAEAKYYIAWIDFDTDKTDLCEKEIFELVDKYAAYDYWVAKSFILLADVYLKKDNVFQAKETLQSVIDNYNGADLVKLAQMKKDKIIEQETLKEQKDSKESITDEQEI